jgi:hypothetical protein
MIFQQLYETLSDDARGAEYAYWYLGCHVSIQFSILHYELF